MSSVARLEPGYYGNLLDFLEYNPARGGIAWMVHLRHCVSEASGWFVVDGATYAGSALVGLDLRFEQHCWGLEPALRGQIHWSAGE